MRLVVVTANWPHRSHSVRAANVIVFELVRALADCPGLTVGFLKVGQSDEPDPGPQELEGCAALEAGGVEVLPSITLPPSERTGTLVAKFFNPKPEHFYPDVVHGPRIAEPLTAWKADALLVPLSEWLTAACSTVPVLRFAYYGNPDHKTARNRFAHDARLGGSRLKYWRVLLALKRLEKVHVQIMRRYQLLANVAANDAEYYKRAVRPDAFYMRNIWIDRFGEGWREKRRALEQCEPLVIVGNVGKLEGTANRLGLEYLGRKLLPALRRRMSAGSYRIEILGAGTLHPTIAETLRGPDVVIRGFVPDIDEAMLAAPVFLCLNNASPFKVCHTRYLHAWTLGSCVIAHRDAALSIVEMVDGKNALLGRDADEIAEAIAQAAKDPDLRYRIGEGGWESYKKHFRASHVAEEIAEKLRAGAAQAATAQLQS